MKKLIYLSLAFILFSVSSVLSQDKIYKKGGEVIEAKITEIGTKEIKYKAFANLEGPVYTLNKEQILKITYENGKTENFNELLTDKDEVIEQKRAQNVFVELLGQGLVFSANYDTRFGNRRNGIGGRVGIGGFSVDESTVITVPVSVNYLLGKNNGKSFFEIGLGATYIGLDASDEFLDAQGSAVLGTMSFMYRVQPVDSGFSFRGGLTPIFGQGGFIPYYFGLSLGYTF